MFFCIVLAPISVTSGQRSTGNTRKYHQIDVYIYQCGQQAHRNKCVIRNLVSSFQPKHMFGVLIRTVSLRWFFTAPPKINEQEKTTSGH